jgi:DNA-binding CsgD family transcriptional regulator
MNKILDMWADYATQDEIAEALGIVTSTVVRYIQRARRRGDPRALRLFDRRTLRRHMLDKQVTRLFAAGMSKADIAKGLGVTVRCVEMRIKRTTAT